MEKNLCALLSVSLIALSLLGSVGCSDTSDAPAKDSQTTTTGVISDETATWADTIPYDINYDGYSFNIGWSSPNNINECVPFYEEIAGDVVGEAIYKRNQQTEEKLNIVLNSEPLPCAKWDEMAAAIDKLILSNDTTFDVYCASTWFLFKSSIKGYLVPINNITSLDISNAWWDSEFINMNSLGSSKSYLLNGHINYLDDYACSALYINKVMCTDLGLDYPYALVRNGGWTYDKFLEYVNSSTDDLDGDGDYDQNDKYGIIENTGVLIRFLPAFGENVIVFDSEGNADLNSKETFITKIQNVFSTLLDTGNNAVVIAERKLGYDLADSLFTNGQALFYSQMVNSILGFRRSMEDDFGILPFPKYDESQKNYYSSYNTAWGTSYSVPITNSEHERTGWILETMGFYSTDTVLPVSIEVNVMTKLTRDNESAEMLRIIFDNKFYELGQWGSSIYGPLGTSVLKGQGDIASLFDKVRKQTTSEFAAVKDYYSFDGK